MMVEATLTERFIQTLVLYNDTTNIALVLTLRGKQNPITKADFKPRSHVQGF